MQEADGRLGRTRQCHIMGLVIGDPIGFPGAEQRPAGLVAPLIVQRQVPRKRLRGMSRKPGSSGVVGLIAWPKASADGSFKMSIGHSLYCKVRVIAVCQSFMRNYEGDLLAK